jgi:ketosteroid isomerase-like protein
MARFRLRMTRYPDVLDAIERRLAADGALACSLGAGRVHLVLRGAGATRWVPEAQLARALAMADAARAVLAADPRPPVRVHAGHAVVVRYEDVAATAGCDVRATWECVIPSAG